ncbi:MAG: hypothetical protein LBG57_05340 [Treponema sp.]|jgi:hypothetical protein|nr:hypothetical protein [Treponema sp.]
MKGKMRIVKLFVITVILGSCVSTTASNSAVSDLVKGVPLSDQCELGIIESIGLTQIDSTPMRTIWGNAVITIPAGHHKLVYDYSNTTYGSARNLSMEFDFEPGKHYSLRRHWGDSAGSGIAMGLLGASGTGVIEIVENGNARWNIPGIDNALPNDKEGVIVFDGIKVSWPLVVLINGQKMFSVNKNETLSMRVPNGSHRLAIVRERDDIDPEGVDITVSSNITTAVLSCSGMTGAKSITLK